MSRTTMNSPVASRNKTNLPRLSLPFSQVQYAGLSLGSILRHHKFPINAHVSSKVASVTYPSLLHYFCCFINVLDFSLLILSADFFMYLDRFPVEILLVIALYVLDFKNDPSGEFNYLKLSI